MGVTSLLCWGRRLESRELPPATLPAAAAWGPGCPSVCLSVCLSVPGHWMQHHGALCCDLPLCRGCCGFIPVGDVRMRPDSALCSPQLRCHQHRLLTAVLALGSLSHCRTLKGLQPPVRTGRSLLPEHHCLSPHTCSTSPPRSCRATCLPHETSLQQDAEKCL